MLNQITDLICKNPFKIQSSSELNFALSCTDSTNINNKTFVCYIFRGHERLTFLELHLIRERARIIMWEFIFFYFPYCTASRSHKQGQNNKKLIREAVLFTFIVWRINWFAMRQFIPFATLCRAFWILISANWYNWLVTVTHIVSKNLCRSSGCVINNKIPDVSQLFNRGTQLTEQTLTFPSTCRS